MTSGYQITYRGFLPVGATLDEMMAGSKTLLDLEATMKAAGLVDVKRSDTFVKGTRAKSSAPSGAAVSPAETGRLRPEAPAEAEGPQNAATADDLLSLEGTHLDRSANRKPAA